MEYLLVKFMIKWWKVLFIVQNDRQTLQVLNIILVVEIHVYQHLTFLKSYFRNFSKSY